MTKGQEIANEWFNIGVPVGTDTKQQLAMTIDAAIAEAVSKTRDECARTCNALRVAQRMPSDLTWNMALYEAEKTIIGLNDPPVPAKPVWCEHIHLAGGCVWTLKGKYTQGHWRDDVGWAVPEFMHHCPVAGCGKPRPEVCGAPRTKGS